MARAFCLAFFFASKRQLWAATLSRVCVFDAGFGILIRLHSLHYYWVCCWFGMGQHNCMARAWWVVAIWRLKQTRLAAIAIHSINIIVISIDLASQPRTQCSIAL